MHHARRRNRELRRDTVADVVLQESEVVGEDRLAEADVFVDAQRGGSEVERAAIVVELHVQLLVRLSHTPELVDEVHVPRRAPEFSVGRGLQTDIALHRDHIADRRVLHLTQCGRGDRTRGLIGSCLHERRGAQKAADVVGAKGWLSASAHRP